MGKKLDSLLLFLKAVLYLLCRGGARRSPCVPPKKILIVQSAKLGDMVCTTPMFRAVKRAYPDVELWVGGSRVNKALLEHNRDVDHYCIWENEPDELIRIIREQGFDYACITTPDVRSLAILALAGISSIASPKVIGGEPIQTRTYPMLSKCTIQVEHRMGCYAPREYLKLLEPLRIIATDTRKYLSFSAQAAARVAQFIENHRGEARLVVAVAPSAGNKIKLWPPDRFAAVSEYLVRHQNAVVFLVGGQGDREEVEAVTRLTSSPRIVYALNVFSVDELKAFISRLDLFVSADTGPIYIAEAFGVRTVDIVGPMDEKGQPPTGKRHAVVLPPGSRVPQLFVLNARAYDVREARRQMEATEVVSVISAVERVLCE